MTTVGGAFSNAYSYDPAGRLSTVTDSASAAKQLLLDIDSVVGEYDASGTLLGRYIPGPYGGAPVVRGLGDGPRRPHPLRGHPQSLDEGARALQAIARPPHVGTEHLAAAV